jgi:tRNA dimethylallyltransferase
MTNTSPTSKPKLLIIVGPTASGKSSLAVDLATQFNGEVISADSRQVYRGLNLGTGKITQEEMQGVPHHLLDVAEPTDQFSVTDWRTLAEKAIADIRSRGKLPIICGGTGFYISTLVDDLTLPDVPANQELRDELAKETVDQLFSRLQILNPERASTMNQSDRKNPRRLVRAIEIAQHPQSSTEKPITTRESSYDTLWIGLDLPIEDLRKNIQDRLDKRLHQGMIGEVQTLHEKGLSWERMEELGLEYRFIAQHLQSKITMDKMKEKLAVEIGQYAKRQMTWFRRNKDIMWFTPSDTTAIGHAITSFVHRN